VDIYEFLSTHRIEFQKFDHPPVYTCEEVNRLVPDLPGAKTKNLFVRDKKGIKHFLVVVGDEKVVDLKALAKVLEVTRLSFASPERLKKYLELDPGSVSLLGIVNDSKTEVAVIIDRAIWEQDQLQCHPLINTSTLVISRTDIERILEITGHSAEIVDVPERSDD